MKKSICIKSAQIQHLSNLIRDATAYLEQTEYLMF